MKRRLLSKRALVCLLVVVVVVIAGVIGWKPLLIRYRLGQAREALEARDAESALKWLQANERLVPDHAETHFWLARTYRRLGRFEEVRNHIERAWKLGYSMEMLKREQWLALAQSGQLQQAERHLGELLKDPRNDGREICEAFVAGYLLNYRFQPAFRILEAWQKDYPQDPYPYMIRGKIWEARDAPKKAIENYRKVLKLDSTQRKARLRLANLLVQMHRHEKAAEHYQRCLKEDPQNPDVLVGWSNCLRSMGRNKEARAALGDALKSEPNHLQARIAMGRLELASGHPKQALRWLEPVVKDVPLDSTVRYALAQALQRAGRTEAAKKHFQFASEAARANARIQILVEQLQREPNNTELRYKIGIARLQFQPTTALIWLRSVVEINPDHRRAHEALAAYYAQRDQAKLAEYHRKRAEQLKGKPGGS